MLLYPRLPAPTARILIEEIGDTGLDELRQRSSTRHPACTYSPTGGNRIDEREIAELRETLRTIADECGYPRSVGPAERVRFDHRVASVLHADMGIVPADAAEPGVWAFLACVAVPEIVCWRFPRRTPERLEGGQRNALRRLWWRAHVLGSELMSRLGEDELVQIMERPESPLGNPRIARAVAAMHIKVCDDLKIEGRMRVLRDAAKRVLRLSALMTLDALDDESLSHMAQRVLTESAVALEETDVDPPAAQELHLLAHAPAADRPNADGDDARLRGAARAAVPDPDIVSGSAEGAFNRSDIDIIPGTTGPLSRIPLGQVRLAVTEAIRHGCGRLESLPGAAADHLGMKVAALSPVETTVLMLTARSAQHHGWIEIDDLRGELQFRATPSGSAVADGQLMRHSLSEIAASLVSTVREEGPGVDPSDGVIEALGYSPPANPGASDLIGELRQVMLGSEAAEQS